MFTNANASGSLDVSFRRRAYERGIWSDKPKNRYDLFDTVNRSQECARRVRQRERDAARAPV
jgi:hypothetical protein